MIFFAGHGRERGFLIPWEGRDSDDALWVSTDEVRRVLQRSDARHILVLSDAWFAGDFLPRTRPLQDVSPPQWPRMYSRMSRSVISFDGNSPAVVGHSSPGSSVFSTSLLAWLRANTRPVLLPATPAGSAPLRQYAQSRQRGYVPPIHIEEMLDAGSADGAFMFFLDPALASEAPVPLAIDTPPATTADAAAWIDRKDSGGRAARRADILLTSPRGGVLEMSRGRKFPTDGHTVVSLPSGTHRFVLHLASGDRLYGLLSIGELDEAAAAVTYGHTVGVYFKASHVRRALQGQPVRYEVGGDPKGGSMVSYLLSLQQL